MNNFEPEWYKMELEMKLFLCTASVESTMLKLLYLSMIVPT